MPVSNTSVSGVAAGVPFLAVPPVTASPTTPVVFAWHLMDPPRTEAAFAAALPLAGLDAWRIYLGLPMFGSRMPAGGFEEIMRLAAEDAVLNLYQPVANQALQEFPDALAELRTQLDLGECPLAFLGGSFGAAIAMHVLTESDVAVSAAVLVSPVVQLRATVDALARQYGATYSWSDVSRAAARRLDFAERADEIAARSQPAILVLVGEHDDQDGFRQPAARLRDALGGRYDDPSRVGLTVVPGMAHALAEEPGIEPAPQAPHAAKVDRLAVTWFQRHLS